MALRTLALAIAGLAAFAPAATAQTPAFSPKEESVEALPALPGREETFGFCSACHAYRLVANQGMSRERWDETLVWMTQRHNLPELAGAERDLILDYLAKAHPEKPASRTGGFRNPFTQP